MTENQAFTKAQRLARQQGRDFYVIYDREAKTHLCADESFIEAYGWDYLIKGYFTPDGFCH